MIDLLEYCALNKKLKLTMVNGKVLELTGVPEIVFNETRSALFKRHDATVLDKLIKIYGDHQ